MKDLFTFFRAILPPIFPKKEFWIVIERFYYSSRTTIGRMYFEYDGQRIYFGYTLEDTVRPYNIKVYGETAIPAYDFYYVKPYNSPRFDDTIIFYTEADGTTIKIGDIVFEYVYAHGGNTHFDTSGCILIAKNRVASDKIQGSLKDDLSKEIRKRVEEGYVIRAKTVNLPQLN